MATALQKLKEEGWFISEEGFKKISENGLIADVKELKKRALDHDLRDLVTNGGLPNDIAKSSKLDLPSSGVVLQVVNVRNVSAPKANQESKTSPRLLQIDLSDGQTLCSGLDLDFLSSFSINVAPGTKVLLRNTVKVIQGILSLSPQNISILGGEVPALYEKWESSRTLAKYGGAGGQSKKGEGLKGQPPPWISFGNKIKSMNDDASFKSLGTPKTKEVSKEESEFLALRNAAIADAATKGELRKQFGGSNRQLIDYNVKKILDKGYTEEQAKHALKLARNNLERAMSSLKKRNSAEAERKPRTAPEISSSNSKRGHKSDDPPPARPSGKVSLFDFLEDKIKIPETEPVSEPKSSARNAGGNKNQASQRNSNAQDNARSKFENNISSSFASRQKRDDPPLNRSKPKQENSSSSAPQSSAKSSTFQQYQSSSTQPSYSHPSYKSSHYNDSRQNAPQYQNANSNYQQNNKNSRYQSSENQYNDKRPNTDRRQAPPSNTNPSKQRANVNELIESTANMKISGDAKQSYKQNQSQHQSQQQSARNQNANPNAFEEMFKNVPNHYQYNPYKIMGFQNKETNEFAMNVLKTQMMENQKTVNSSSHGNTNTNAYAGNNRNNLVAPNNQQQQQQQQQQPSNIKHNQHADYAMAPPPQQQQPQHIPIVPVQQMQAPKPNYQQNVAYNMAPPQQPQFILQSWSFKVGDRCLAKYWEDERYYNAEIQAVTDKTCVVRFLEYDNIEEVLLTDCLPITDANHQPINQYGGAPPPHHYHQSHNAMQGQPIHQYQQPQYVKGQHRGNDDQRFRNNRQVYVPPAQRK